MSLVDYGAVLAFPPARFHEPPFKPYVRFSRIRLNDDLLDAACVRPRPTHDAAFHRGVMPVVTLLGAVALGAHR